MVIVCVATMTTDNSISHYVLGSTNAEHERLIWQAERLAPVTERLFREAGIGLGQRVLDIGSGVGDVAMLVSRLVGATGEVVGVERDASSIARAKARVSQAGLRNVRFVQADISQIAEETPFDAAVGRMILTWLPDPVFALRRVGRLVRPDGVIAFLESGWAPVLSMLESLPLWSAAAALICEVSHQSGGNLLLGHGLYEIFQNAGIRGPTMFQEIRMGKDPDNARWFADILRSLWPRVQQLNLSVEAVGNLDTLAERLQAEVQASHFVVGWLAPVCAWARK